MAWTQTDLDNIEKAIASGAKRVKLEGKEVEYASLDEMLRVRDLIRAKLGETSGWGHVNPSFSKGICR